MALERDRRRRPGEHLLNSIGFDYGGEELHPGIVALVTPDGSARQVADGLSFPNGMAVTPDNTTLIVAESYANRLTAFDIDADGGLSNRRVWADLGDGVPDGVCLDAEGAVWYGDVPNRCCVRVAEGGEVLETIDLDRGCFACMLGGPDERTLLMMVAEWRGPEAMGDAAPTGKVVTAEAPARGRVGRDLAGVGVALSSTSSRRPGLVAARPRRHGTRSPPPSQTRSSTSPESTKHWCVPI